MTMSNEMAMMDNLVGEKSQVNGEEAPVTSAEDSTRASSDHTNKATDTITAEDTTANKDSEVDNEPAPNESSVPYEKPMVNNELPKDDKMPEENTEVPEDSEEVPEEKRGVKRRASLAFNNADDEEFKGFDQSSYDDSRMDYSRTLERLEAEVSAASENFTPLRHVLATSTLRTIKRTRNDTDSSRPSSALSSRSEGEGGSSETASPPGRAPRRPTTEMSSPLLRVPLERGWRRELVHRAALDPHNRRNADIYYYTPAGKKLRSTREVAEQLSGTGLTLENFSFFKEPLGVDDPEKEIIRDAKLMRKGESPAAASASSDGKRVPKPRTPKLASPEPAPPKSPPAKLKVKSLGSRISSSSPAPPPATKPQKKAPATPTATTTPDNNNSAAWKKPSEEKKRGRVSNGAAPPPAATPSPRRRGRPKPDDTDHFTGFINKAKELKYDVAVQIFQYLGMRDLARCARVCRLWRQLASEPALWRHVRMKNSHVSDWAGLFSALRRHGCTRLDLRKMLLPHDDTVFWDQFCEHIGSVPALQRLELCRCPSRAVESACSALPALLALSALAVRDGSLDPAPLQALPLLQELRLKSLAGLRLSRDLSALTHLTHLNHLSLTSIKDLGWMSCESLGSLENLETLELGECTFSASFGGVLAKLRRLRRLRLERGTAQCAAPAILRALSTLPKLVSLELVNVDVKAGFDDALAECKNIQRLLIIPTYVSQSATTNKQVLSGVLRLKDTLTHLMWGVTIELLRVTELFIDQCEQTRGARRDAGECIPVLKPVPGGASPAAGAHGPPQVEILPLPTLQRLLSSQLPNTKLKLLRIPFHATWRQSLADFQ